MSPFGVLSAEQVKKILAHEAIAVEGWLETCLDAPGIPERLRAAMRYSLLAGGKRIRPVLCLLSARMHGLSTELAMPFAGALECIHTYSLIHDDLPAMDDDDLRRGKPSNHKQFDEATAILAGDALLTDAFHLMGMIRGILPERVLAALVCVADAAGSRGMVGGQMLDMQYTAEPSIGIDAIASMHAMKTGALLRASGLAGALLAGADAEQQRAMRRYGELFGAAFQIMDDILDEIGNSETLGKPVGSDAANNKMTYPALMGLEISKVLAREKATEAALELQGYGGEEAELLRGLAGYIILRLS